jgi:hypothetical protein
MEQYLASVKNATKEELEFLHPCFYCCKKWATCASKAECVKNIDSLIEVWEAARKRQGA